MVSNNAPSAASDSDRVARLRLPRPSSEFFRALFDRPLRAAEDALGLTEVEGMARRVAEGDPALPLGDRIAATTGIDAAVRSEEWPRVPAAGATLVCANHPFGGADSTALLTALLRRRPDVKFLANSMLGRIPLLAEHLILVDPFGCASATRRNARALREAIEWLRGGHLLAAFPAGEVSAITWSRWTPSDPAWSTIPARLALQTGAKVVPAWIEGTNSRAFHAAGLIHPRLRTALIPREFVARCGSRVELRFGRPIATEGSGLDSEGLTRIMRTRSELLRRSHASRPARAATPQAPIASPIATADELASEFASLPREALLFREGDHAVYAVRASWIPKAMTEIGRLREVVFRAVGEGSGKAIDLDRFDPHYWHLLVWNEASREIVGGYRAGIVSEVTRDAGLEGLYTDTLFRYSAEMVMQLADAVELGRAFVVPHYQRQALPLSQLWKGIAVFMFRHGLPRMFGPVSISNDYASQSKELLMEFLERHRLAAPLAKGVSPRNPPVRRRIDGWTHAETERATRDLGEVERMIDDIERGERAVPVLLRHYLRLNARLLAFNVDHDFGEVVDALMLVDIRDIDERIVRHYGGDAAVATVAAWRAAALSAR
jgi:putative hemolysin